MAGITAAQLTAIAGGRPVAGNIASVVLALDTYGAAAGLDKPHRLAHFIAQLAHESGGFKYDREIWGPTAAQKRYEGRKDLGNTVKGDGKKFAGRGPIQLTGRGNVTRFHRWCIAKGYGPPDFVKKPDLINTDPWEGLSAIWFWSVGNQTGKSLNVYADENNPEKITKVINGGLNGYDDRLRYYVRAALVILGFGPDDVRLFQKADKLVVDGDAGPKTRAGLHMRLAALSGPVRAAPVTASPVVTEKPVEVTGPKGKSVADAAGGVGLGSLGLSQLLKGLQDQLTPFSAAGGWIGSLVVWLIIGGAVLTVGGFAYSWWAKRKKAEQLAQLAAPKVAP